MGGGERGQPMGAKPKPTARSICRPSGGWPEAKPPACRAALSAWPGGRRSGGVVPFGYRRTVRVCIELLRFTLIRSGLRRTVRFATYHP